jgi:hypothetical protein
MIRRCVLELRSVSVASAVPPQEFGGRRPPLQRLLILSAKFFEEGRVLGCQCFLELLGAIAVAACPCFRSVFVAAIAPRVGVLDAQQIKIFFPVRSFFFQRWVAETCFNPGGDAVRVDTRLLHVVQIFIARDGTAAEGALVNRLHEPGSLAGFQLRFDEIAHV